MTRLLSMHAVLALACAVLPPTLAVAQQPASRDTVLDTRLLPQEVEREVTEAFNSPSTVRSTGAYEVEPGRVVPGDVAVLNGPLTIAGRVNGRVVAINSDVILKPGARVEGQILVVGGNVEGKDDAFIGGDVRTYRQRLTYRRDGERLIASGSSEEDARWWRRRQKWRSHSYSDLRLVSAKTYNRVEGLPVLVGPSFGAGSFARHAARAAAVGATVKVRELPSLGLDVDTPDDLAALREALGARPEGAARTRAVLDKLAATATW